MMAQNMLAVPGRRAGDFWIFWTGQTISQIGSALTSTALLLLEFCQNANLHLAEGPPFCSTDPIPPRE